MSHKVIQSEKVENILLKEGQICFDIDPNSKIAVRLEFIGLSQKFKSAMFKYAPTEKWVACKDYLLEDNVIHFPLEGNKYVIVKDNEV